MSDIINSEIDIPTPINRPKENLKVKAPHPASKIVAKDKPFNLQPGQISRFEQPAIEVELPSHGMLYGDFTDPKVARGIIKIRPITLNEEKILTTDRLVQQGRALDMILENCIKSEIDSYELLSSDRLYLLFYLRGMSYDLTYDFVVKCYHCGFNFEQTIEVDKLAIDEWTKENFRPEPLVVKLPFSKATVEAHYMRGKDEQKLTEKARALKNLNSPDDAQGDYISALIDKVIMPDKEVLSQKDKEDFINHLVAGDTDFFRDFMNQSDCGIKPLEHVYCPKCEGELEFNVPLGRNFFRRSRQREKSTKV